MGNLLLYLSQHFLLQRSLWRWQKNQRLTLIQKANEKILTPNKFLWNFPCNPEIAKTWVDWISTIGRTLWRWVKRNYFLLRWYWAVKERGNRSIVYTWSFLKDGFTRRKSKVLLAPMIFFDEVFEWRFKVGQKDERNDFYFETFLK